MECLIQTPYTQALILWDDKSKRRTCMLPCPQTEPWPLTLAWSTGRKQILLSKCVKEKAMEPLMYSGLFRAPSPSLHALWPRGQLWPLSRGWPGPPLLPPGPRAMCYHKLPRTTKRSQTMTNVFCCQRITTTITINHKHPLLWSIGAITCTISGELNRSHHRHPLLWIT